MSGGIKFYSCPSVRTNFRQAFLRNCTWEQFEIWQGGSVSQVVRPKRLSDLSDNYFLFATGPIWKCVNMSMKISVKLFSETVHQNNLKFGRVVQYHKLYVLSDFQTCWTTTSCLGLPLAGASVSHGHILQFFSLKISYSFLPVYK